MTIRGFLPFCFFVWASVLSAEDRPPNVIFILTDNHGAWTLGCYGNEDIQTPHIDRLADEGVLFSNAYANNPVCSPTRASFLTGLMPSQHGVHNFLRGGRLQTGPDARNTLEEFTSLPEILDRNGNACGLVGKWHLGGNEQPQEALDDYWITKPHGGTATFHEAQVINMQGETVTAEGHLTPFWTKHALQFIEEQKGNPFFLYLAYNGPYGLSRFQLEDLRGPRVADYENETLESFPGGLIHPWEYNNREYFGHPTAIRRYAAEVSAIDDGVGEVLATLKRLGLDENTLIVFAGDQGWAGGQRGLWGMGDHTRPTNAFDYSLRIPFLIRHPGGIPGGRTSDLMTSNYDLLPSLLGYLGLEEEAPTEIPLPGQDFSPMLRGEKVQDWEQAIYHEYEDLRCIRTTEWKLIERYEEAFDELYHLPSDPEEKVNLWGLAEHATMQAELQSRLDAFFETHAEPKYDLWKGGVSQPMTLTWGEEAQAREADRALRGTAPSPFDPAWNPPTMTIPEGMVVEVVAAPPLVQHPMMACFDDEGRLFVAEAAGLNLNREELEEQLPNQIRVLEDTNNDGIFDQSTIFADDMTFPQGVQWLNGAIYAASPPGIWRLMDTDDDGVADQRFEIATGFDFTGNAADVHGPFLHPNGRLYWCHGRKGHVVWDRDQGRLVSQGKGARIWSSRPDGSDIQVHAGGGMDNPVEVAFTPEGEIIGTVNLFYGRPRGDTLVHWLKGGAYPRHDQAAVVAEFPRTGDLLTEIHNYGHVAVSGMCLYESGTLNADWQGDAITSFFNTGKIVRTDLKRDGATWKPGLTETILEAHGEGVHFTDVLEDADGSLLAVDTGGWFRIGCPTSQMARPEIPGAIYRLRPAGIRDRVTDWRGQEIDWASLDLNAQAALLRDERPLVRQRAIAEIAVYDGDAAEVLKPILESDTQEHRLAALWAACRQDAEGCRDLIRWAAEDPNPIIATAACNAIAATGDPIAVDVLVAQVMENNSPSVKLAAATALSVLENPQATGALMDQLAQTMSRTLEHAIMHALIRIADWENTLPGLQNSDPEARRRTLWVLDQMDGSELQPEQLLGLIEEESSPPLVADAIQIASAHEEWATAAGRYFHHWLDQGSLQGGQLEVVEGLAPIWSETEAIQEIVGRLAAHEEDFIDSALKIMANAESGAALPESWSPALRTAIQSTSLPERRLLAIQALSRLQTSEFEAELQEIANDPEEDRPIRFWALRAGSELEKPLPSPAFGLLLEMLQPDTAAEERAQAVALVGRQKFTVEQMVQLAGPLSKAGPVDFTGILVPFGIHRSAEVGEALSEVIASSPAAASVPVMELSRVLTRYPPESVIAAGERLDSLEHQESEKLVRLEALTEEVDAGIGDAERGKAAFLAGKGACITCHMVASDGRDVGPNLSTIGRIRSPRDLLESVIFPGASIARDFEGYTICMKDGAQHMGVVRTEDRESLQVVLAGGLEINLAREDIATQEPAPISLMPSGLDLSMEKQDLVDIVTWLNSLE